MPHNSSITSWRVEKKWAFNLLLQDKGVVFCLSLESQHIFCQKKKCQKAKKKKEKQKKYFVSHAMLKKLGLVVWPSTFFLQKIHGVSQTKSVNCYFLCRVLNYWQFLCENNKKSKSFICALYNFSQGFSKWGSLKPLVNRNKVSLTSFGVKMEKWG